MFRLKLLGGASLEAPTGLLAGRVVQPRQLALLALLAGSRPELLTRDKITGILWPDVAPDRARSRLSDALHVVRKSLGEAAVLTPGGNLGLNANVLRSDVREFRGAVQDGAWEEAMAAYGGAFLDGFRFDGAAAFERWVDRQRQGLRRDARRAADRLAAACEEAGERKGAAKWARHALAIDPYDEEALRRLLEILGRGGGRAEAVRAYESFADRLRCDLGLEPSAETAGLVRKLRNRQGAVPAPPAGPARRIRSLAVLPLESPSGHGEGGYFAAGMQDALIAGLSRIDGLRVISRTSARAVDRDSLSVPDIARRLGVDAVLEGAVVRSAGHVRVQLNLVRALPEEEQIWEGSYERPLGEVLELHAAVTRDIAGEIRPHLSPGTAERIARARRVNPAMYEAYLRGTFHLNQLTPEGIRRGLRHLRQAVEEDPADPLPYAALALGCSQFGHESGDPGTLFPRAREAALRALELDDTLAEAHEALAETKLYWEWDWRGAEAAFDRALQLDPNLAPAHAHRGFYLHLHRRWEEGLAEMRRAAELDPLVPLYPAWAGWQLRYMGRPERAIEEARSSLELQEDFPVGLYVLGSACADTGRFEEAIECQERVRAVSPAWGWGLGQTLALAGREDRAREIAAELEADPSPMTPFGLALIHMALGETDATFRWLEAAFDTRFSWVPWVAVYPTFQPLADDPRFAALLERLDLPEVGRPAWSPS